MEPQTYPILPLLLQPVVENAVVHGLESISGVGILRIAMEKTENGHLWITVSDNGIGSEHWGDFIFGNETNEKYGVVTDAVVAGNGTYTVSVTDFGTIFADDFKTAGQEWFNLLFISTDIPMDENVKVTDVKLIIDGKTVHKYAEAYLDPDTTDYVKILIQNIWNEDVKEISYYAAPTTSLEMSFTISGFDYDA